MGFQNPLSAAALAAAIASTTLTVTGSVNTTPTTPTPGEDEDIMRVLDQPGINALTAADKATNFSIWNTTTAAINYVVNGAVVIPPTGAPKFGSVSLTNQVIPATYGTYQVAIGAGVTTVDLLLQNNGQQWIQGSVTADVTKGLFLSTGNSSPTVQPTPFSQINTGASDVLTWYASGVVGGNTASAYINVRNMRLDSDGFLRWEWSVGSGAAMTLNSSLARVAWVGR